MYLIDASYFIGKLSVANLNEPNSPMLEQVGLYVDEKVRLLLQNALGFELFKELDDNVTSGVLDVGAPQKWKDLVNGVEYEVNGKSYKWNGLLFTQGLYKKSLLANFCFHEWRTDTLRKDNVIQPKNVSVTNQNSFLVDVWNEFVNAYQGDYSNCVVKENLITRDCIIEENTYNDNVSLLRFLYDKKADYSDAKMYLFPNATYSNSLGI